MCEVVRRLEHRPTWRAEVRRLVLTSECVRLPVLARDPDEIVRQMVQVQREAFERLEPLEAAQQPMPAAWPKLTGASA